MLIEADTGRFDSRAFVSICGNLTLNFRGGLVERSSPRSTTTYLLFSRLITPMYQRLFPSYPRLLIELKSPPGLLSVSSEVIYLIPTSCTFSGLKYTTFYTAPISPVASKRISSSSPYNYSSYILTTFPYALTSDTRKSPAELNSFVRVSGVNFRLTKKSTPSVS